MRHVVHAGGTADDLAGLKRASAGILEHGHNLLAQGMAPEQLARIIATLNDRMRRRMMWIALVLLVTLAGVEAALALMRDMLIADKQALIQSLATVQQAHVADGWVSRIPTAGQMLLGFILPFALAFIAIPLESLIHSSRTVGGVLLAQ